MNLHVYEFCRWRSEAADKAPVSGFLLLSLGAGKIVQPLDFIESELVSLRDGGLLREPPTDAASPVATQIDAASNDYLGYSRRAVSRATLLACEDERPGAGASRLIFGTAPIHLALERELADWVGLESALLFSSGYAANLGVIASLGRAGDLVVSDSLNHASIIDGCRLSRATIRVVSHRKPEAVAHALREDAARKFVVTESYFSMDGDLADLAELRRVCDRAGAALIVDEAHALGVFGPSGAGRCRALGVKPDVLIGTLGKAIGVQGAFVAGSHTLTTWLWNRARSLVFSTGTAPFLCAVCLEHVRRAREDEAGRQRLHENARSLRARLRAGGVEVLDASEGPIVPIVLGDNARAVRVAERLQRDGYRVQAIRPPTVPAGTARLRVTVSAVLGDEELGRLGASLIAACVESLNE